MVELSVLQPLAGGALIGLAASLLLWGFGRVAGISGIFGGLLLPKAGEIQWRLVFLAGLLSGGLLLRVFSPEAFGAAPRGLGWLLLAGLLVGLGTRLGGGCTSGHGVCGISHLSTRSIVATLTFIATGVLTVLAVRLLTGGAA